MKEYITNTHDETVNLGYKLGQQCTGGEVFLLKGDLGAGKTTWTKGLALGLGIKQSVNSPTFVIQKEYEGRLKLIHIDAYRLEGIEQDLGFEDFVTDENVVVIEWPQFLVFPELSATLVEFEYLNDTQRKITISEVNS